MGGMEDLPRLIISLFLSNSIWIIIFLPLMVLLCQWYLVLWMKMDLFYRSLQDGGWYRRLTLRCCTLSPLIFLSSCVLPLFIGAAKIRLTWTMWLFTSRLSLQPTASSLDPEIRGGFVIQQLSRNYWCETSVLLTLSCYWGCSYAFYMQNYPVLPCMVSWDLHCFPLSLMPNEFLWSLVQILWLPFHSIFTRTWPN